jgi:hypothetical protein
LLNPCGLFYSCGSFGAAPQRKRVSRLFLKTAGACIALPCFYPRKRIVRVIRLGGELLISQTSKIRRFGYLCFSVNAYPLYHLFFAKNGGFIGGRLKETD